MNNAPFFQEAVGLLLFSVGQTEHVATDKNARYDNGSDRKPDKHGHIQWFFFRFATKRSTHGFQTTIKLTRRK